MVRRLLPIAQQRHVGPFIFFDHMGPADFAPGHAVNVRPHPHIGLATLTYLFEGQILHRDSLASCQTIDPGDVNWMIAGSGIVHSERVTDAVRASGQRLHGLQLWIALPAQNEETAPEFHHHPNQDLPHLSFPGAKLTLVAGSAFGQSAPVKTFSPMAMLEIHLEPGATLTLPRFEEVAIYPVDAPILVNGEELAPCHLACWIDGETVTITARHAAHLVMIGGDRLAEPRVMFWNFVSSRKERLEQAKQDWKEGRFDRVPGDALELIPLPE